MSGLLVKPKNSNLLQPTKYVVTFPEIPDTMYFCQKANIPGVTLPSLSHVTPNLDLYVAATKITYGEFRIEFLVNEDISAWLSMYNWMKGITTDMAQRTHTNKQCTLTVMSNLNNPKLRVKFYNIFPLTLGDVQFDTTQSAEEHVISTASFRYDYYEIEPIS